VNHDPVLHSNYLRQCLSQEKRRLAIFLGAGCPMAVRVNRHGHDEPLIPDIAGMTAHVSTVLEASDKKDLFEQICAHFKDDGRDKPNVESLLSHIRSLKQVAGNDLVRGCKAVDLEDLDTKICDAVAHSANERLPSKDTPYHKLAAWIGAIQRSYPVEIYTTNYDLLMEQALEENRVPYFDGFVGSHKTFFDLQAMEDDHLPERWARLWKIHGSLNWHEEKNGAVHRGDVSGKRRVIYPSHLKYDESRRMPYLAMMDRLRAFLKQSTAVVIVCGYSFSDNHINEVIVQGLQGNPTATAFALLHGSLNKYATIASIAMTRSNLNLLAEDQAVIGTKQSSWTSEKDANSCPPNSTAVKWEDHPDPAKKGLKNAHFTLGNFALVGAFLEELIGEKERNVAI
jgi:SIR2-like domain